MKKSKLASKPTRNTSQTSRSVDNFETLYSQYVGNVYQQCLSITKDSQTAQDYTQDIFIKVFYKLDSFQNRSAFTTWLYAISRHYCLDQLRFSKRLSTESLSDQLSDKVTDANQPESVELRMQELETLLVELPSEEIALLRLKHEQGMSVKAISQQFDLSESAVKMRLKRSRDKLMQLYNARAAY